MDRPWEIRIDDKRTANTLFTFNIFCEGRNSEPIYFKWFETSLIKVITHGEQKSMCRNVNKTIAKCLNDKVLKINENGGYELYEEGMEIWCVFDRDKGANGISIEEGDVDFNSAITIADNSPLRVAWSNDSFDLWILLHLLDVKDELELAKDRRYYFGKLTEYFKLHQNPNEALAKALSHPSFSYEKDLKSEKRIAQILLPEIISKTSKAIDRAKYLMSYYEREHDFSKKSPCTTVFQLVERLLYLGKKEIPQ